MESVYLEYDAQDDWLDVRFGDYDDFARTFHLNDQITVFTDSVMTRVTRMTFAGYAQLLLVSETEFTSLEDEDPDVVDELIHLLESGPASCFLRLTYPEMLVARVVAPGIQELLQA